MIADLGACVGYKRQAETRKLMQKLAKLSVRSLRRSKGPSLFLRSVSY